MVAASQTGIMNARVERSGEFLGTRAAVLPVTDH